MTTRALTGAFTDAGGQSRREARCMTGKRPPLHAFAYVHCDVPEGMRLDEWRRARNRGRRTRGKALVANLRRWIGQR
jgi:hypothetical protein